jgi:hypothetical protein
MREMKKSSMVFLKQHQWVYWLLLTSALTAFNPKSVNVDNEKEMYNAVCKTMGKFWYCNLDLQKERWGIL